MVEGFSKKNDEIEFFVSRERPGSSGTRARRSAFDVMPVTPYGKYNLIGKLGHGGMADVFLAYVAGPAGFRKLVVIKRLHAELEEEEGFLDMFLDEARLAARLNHANIVQCFEVGEVDESHFIAMEYLEGQALDRVRRQCDHAGVRLPPSVVARIVVDVLDGLHYSHELKDFDGSPLQIVHRDVSPQNLFVTYDGVVKLLDFGIAKARTHVVETRTGMVKGKFAYMSPEQARGVDVDHRADLWSTGVVLWETLANLRLFKGPNDLATLNQALLAEIPPIDKVVPGVPASLARITQKALSRDARARYRTAHEMKVAIERAMAAEPGGLVDRGELAEHMKRLFRDAIAQHRAVLQACLSETPVPTPPSSVRLAPVGPTPTPAPRAPASGVSTPGPDLLEVAAAAAIASSPTSDALSPLAAFTTPVSSHSAIYPLASPQPRKLGWLGAGVIVLAVVSVLALGAALAISLGTPRPTENAAASEPTTLRLGGVAVAAGPALPEPQSNADRRDAGAAPDAAGRSPVVSGEPALPRDAALATKAQRPTERPGLKRSRPSSAKAPAAAPSPEPVAQPPGPATPPVEPESRHGPDEFGFLTIDTVPWSQVSVGGQALGVTPVVRAKLPAGTHVVTLRNPERGTTTTYRVTINPGQTTSKRLGLR
jgi:eukaryotic-like serine/threonine-protein kinase